MNRSCPNCAAPLRFEVELGKLYCDSCGSSFDVSEFDARSEGYEEQAPETVVYEDEGKKMECKIYRCNTCGAEISITDTEASTFCVYCGNPTIVFDRVSQVKRPDIIIPFTVTKEQAEAKIRERLRKGFLIPKEVKNFKVELLRGIYIPYYVTNLTYADSLVLSGVHSSGKNSTTYYYLRTARCEFNQITTDASNNLNDSISQRLEPYNLKEFKEFDEDYLSGFYADIADVETDEAKRTAAYRAKEIFEKAMLDSISGSSRKIRRNSPRYRYNGKPVMAMFPAWFLTFRYKDRPYTVLVNGQTGKLVGGVPWLKSLYYGLMAAMMVVFCSVFSLIGVEIFRDLGHSSSSDSDDLVKIIIWIVAAAIACFIAGIARMKKVRKAIDRSTEENLTSFVSKRQKGE